MATLAEGGLHKCLIYDGHPSEQLPVIVPLLLEGLRTKRRCLYLGSPDMVAMVSSALAARGVDCAAEAERGALVFSSDRSHLEAGAFDPKAMIASLVGEIESAVKDGFSGLCATGDMRWELGEDRNFERLLEYEALLETVFRDYPLMGICQYHRDSVPAFAIQDALLTHQSAYLGETLAPNQIYIPPEILLDGSTPAAVEKRGEWMSRQLVRLLETERKRDEARAELSRLNVELERRVAERTKELVAALKDLESFSWSVSHDLRAPLRHIKGFLELIRKRSEGALDQQSLGHMNLTIEASERMERLISGLLAFARAGRAEPKASRLSLRALVDEAIRELRPDGDGRAVEWKIGALPEANGDPEMLRGVFLNLIGNALKYTRRKIPAVIEVSAELADGFVVIRVSDNGAGFEQALSDKLFQPFQRLHSEGEFEGSGIGLANVRRIVERHGGRVWAEGAEGRGAAFYFSLPLK